MEEDDDQYNILGNLLEESEELDKQPPLVVKCGEILFIHRKFSFNCTNCDRNFQHFQTYTTHFVTCFQIDGDDGCKKQQNDSFNYQNDLFSSSFLQDGLEERAKEQSSQPLIKNNIRNIKNNNNKKVPTELFNLIVNDSDGRRIRVVSRTRILTQTKRSRTKKKIFYNCRACGKKYFTKVAFKAHKLTKKCCTKDLDRSKDEMEEEVEAGPSHLQLNPPIDTSEKISTNHHINKFHNNTTKLTKSFNCTNCDRTFIFEHLYQEHLKDNRCPTFDLDDGETKEMVINDQMLSAVDALGDRQKDHIFESSENEIQTELDILSDGEIGIADFLDEEMTAFVEEIQKEPFPNELNGKPKPKKHQKNDNGCYSCSLCDKVYDNYKTFTSHIRGHERRYICTYCSKGFPQSTHLKAHLFIHTGERPYKCDECPATFNALGSLRGHKRIHSGERPYPCDYCDKNFLTSSARTIHHRQHTKEIRFVCNVCSKGYINKHLYITHMNKHNNKRDFACELCDQKFFDKWTWKKHQVVHVNDRKYKCDVCEANFPRERTLREHKKLHSKVKEYKCTSCSKEFAQYAGLYSHIKRQHRFD